MIPSPRKPKVSLLGCMSFSLRVWLEVTKSIPVLGLAGLASVGLSSKPEYTYEYSQVILSNIKYNPNYLRWQQNSS